IFTRNHSQFTPAFICNTELLYKGMHSRERYKSPPKTA
ncbi:uncharacterized protein METZ01_LOCUS437474, partial [marine metagenome]